MSDTPRTDAELENYRGPVGMVSADFARQLERDLRQCAAAHMRRAIEPQWQKADGHVASKYINAAPGRPVWFVAGDGQCWIYMLPPIGHGDGERG